MSTHRKIGEAYLSKALELYLENASDTLKAAFDSAFRRLRTRKFDNPRLILAALTECDQDGATHAELLSKVKKTEKEYPAGNLTQYLLQLQQKERGGLVRYDGTSGKYAFSDPIYRVFSKTLFTKEAEGRKAKQIKDFEVKVDLSKLFDELFVDMTRIHKVIASTPKK